jgi:Coenzyme F390 synthetase
MSKIKDLLRYVSENNDFYKKIIKEHNITDATDISQYPILTRQQLQENQYNLFSDGYKAKHLHFQLRRNSSSGTNGMPVSVYWTPDDYRKSMMSIWRKRQKWYGISSTDRFVTFTLPNNRRSEISDNILVLETNYQLLINAASLISEDAYITVIKKISHFEPKWMYIQPFILEQLIYYYKKHNIKPPNSLVHLDSIGEILNGNLKMSALDLFKTSLANLYGSQEHNGIAYECPYGKMHILEDNVYVESGAIITNIINLAFPLIRYNQGDDFNVMPQLTPCKCGSISWYIDEIRGRITQSFDIAGVKITAYTLSEVIDDVNNQFSGRISNFSFCYSVSTKSLKCDISIRNDSGNWSERVAYEIEKAIRLRLPVDEELKVIVQNSKEKILTNKIKILTIED